MAIHSSTTARKIPWTQEPGRLQSIGLQSRTRLNDFTTHSSILAWRIPRTVQSMGSQRVGHDRATFTHDPQDDACNLCVQRSSPGVGESRQAAGREADTRSGCPPLTSVKARDLVHPPVTDKQTRSRHAPPNLQLPPGPRSLLFPHGPWDAHFTSPRHPLPA